MVRVCTDGAYFDVEVTKEGIMLRPVAPVAPVAREDAWVYTPENLARIERGLADLRAGNLISMSPDDLDAYGDEAEAARAAGRPAPRAG